VFWNKIKSESQNSGFISFWRNDKDFYRIPFSNQK